MQYRQYSASVSCDDDITLHQLQLNLQGFVKLLGVLGIQDIHITFVDDLLFPKSHTLLKAVHGAESTVLSGCAALFFFS